MSAIDPITLEVVREALSSIVREMRVTLMRTAYSSILYLFVPAKLFFFPLMNSITRLAADE